MLQTLHFIPAFGLQNSPYTKHVGFSAHVQSMLMFVDIDIDKDDLFCSLLHDLPTIYEFPLRTMDAIGHM